ncbi:phosphodiester glycosidase family protein [Pseudoflavonifractor intestinihominis]|uniref:Phosphodiester glycosidase family protein n=1 Tax=Pseudoflavonifractor intestinihominis TaxID=3133171 RepID=A0ABV1E6J6_9FIRM|nr:phosphodiester glycosidase family protein [uncultured Pseudoflavonifractor sp.]
MKPIFRRTIALALAAALGLAPAAWASEALGHDIQTGTVNLSAGTELTHQIFWSDTYSDLRTERYFTYTPNKNVTPVVAYGDKVTSRETLTTMAQRLEGEGKRLVGGINGDLYVMATGEPLGTVITDGVLRSVPGTNNQGYYAIGFRSDGTAFIGKPDLTVTATFHNTTFQVTGGINKVRLSDGMVLFTDDFGATTQNTQPGVDVILTPVLDDVGESVNVDLDVSKQSQEAAEDSTSASSGEDITGSEDLTGGSHTGNEADPAKEVKGTLTQSSEFMIGSRVTYRVEQVLESTGSIAIPEGKVVLSINNQANSYWLSNVKSLKAGDLIDIDVTTTDNIWQEADQAMGGLYKLVTAGKVESGLPSGQTAYTAVGVKSDGTVIFYTIDGKQPGYSVGASLTQVAMRLVELGCVDAISLDGGGSTTIGATAPNGDKLGVLNKPSDGSQRANSVALFLATDLKPTGELGSFYVTPSEALVLSGAQVQLTATPVDTSYYAMSTSVPVTWSIRNGDGSVDTNGLFTAGSESGTTQVTAASGTASGYTTMTVVKKPDKITISSEASGAAVTSVNLEPGGTLDLKASAVYRTLALTAQDTCFTWTLDPAVGTVDANGVITAGDKTASGSLTVSAGGTTVTIPVTVAGHVKILETFEKSIASVGGTAAVQLSQETASDYVHSGSASLRVAYDAKTAGTASLTTTLTIAEGEKRLNLWIYGDGSGNSLTATIADLQGATSEVALTSLNFTGWKYVSAQLPANAAAIRSINFIYGGGESTGGTVYLDQLTTSNEAIQDTTSPTVSVNLSGGITAVVSDDVDKQFDKSQITLTYDGKTMDFTWNAANSTLTATLPAADNGLHRVTVTVSDASGNLGRGSATQSAAGTATSAFTDTQGHWAASYADYLYQRGITTGVPNEADGTLQFQPDRTITRGEFFAMVARWLGVDMSQYSDVTLPFVDAAQIPDWALAGVKTMYALGYLKGSSDGAGNLSANAAATISRAEAMTILGRVQAQGYAQAELTFDDAASVPDWSLAYVKTLVAQGVISGYENKIMPSDPLRRGEVAKMLFTMT